MSAPTPTALVQQAYAAFGQGDVPALLATFAPEAVWESRYPAGVPFSGAWRGHEGVRAIVQAIGAAIEVLDFGVQQIVAADDAVVVVGFEEARARPTGRRYRNEWVHVWTVRDGQALALRTYNDTAAVGAAFA